MISVKCPACGLVDWNVGDCKRCGTSLVGLNADGSYSGGYFSTPPDHAALAHSVCAARRVMAVCAVVVLVLTAAGVLYLARKPAKKQWFWSFYRNEPTVSEIFAHNLKVSGGAERISKLRSFRAEGQLKFTGGEAAQMAAASGGHVTFVLHAKEPDKIQTEVMIGPPTSVASSAIQAQLETYRNHPMFRQTAQPTVRVNVRRGFDGKKGWEYIERTILTPGSTIPIKQHSSRELAGEELDKLKRYSQPTGLARLSDVYTSLKLNGREPVSWNTGGEVNWTGRALTNSTLNGHEAYVVSGMNREGRNETLYFDTLTGLLLRVDFEVEDEEGKLVKFECVFDDYAQVDGLNLPHRIHFKRGEESMTMTFKKYFPNDPIPDSTFEPTE